VALLGPAAVGPAEAVGRFTVEMTLVPATILEIGFSISNVAAETVVLPSGLKHTYPSYVNDGAPLTELTTLAIALNSEVAVTSTP
jgi:hypothetical protein